jgi:GNAT superfamily N-acetyltransferase
MVIREAGPGDAAKVAALMTQLGYPATADEVGHRFTYWFSDPMSRVLVAERGGRVAGCLSMHAIPYLERTGRWARIESLIVDGSARGTGIGSALMAKAEKVARRWGCVAIEATSLRSRRDAHAFYRHHGYIDVCDRAGRFFKALD